jgi:hypothetical protein
MPVDEASDYCALSSRHYIERGHLTQAIGVSVLLSNPPDFEDSESYAWPSRPVIC